jgi:hypothetical protein
MNNKALNPRLQFLPIKPKRKRFRHSASASDEPPPGPNFPYIEVVNGRAAMYGSVLGLTNWGLTGLNVVEQMSYPPFSLIGLGCTLLATYSVTSAFTTLTEEDFELFAMRNVGRGAMVTFTGLAAAGILGV